MSRYKASVAFSAFLLAGLGAGPATAPVESPESTFTSRTKSIYETNPAAKHVAKKTRDADFKRAGGIDAAIATFDATAEMKKAMFEGRFVIGMTQAEVDLISPPDANRQDEVLKPNQRRFLCYIWACMGGGGPLWDVTLADNKIVRISSAN